MRTSQLLVAFALMSVSGCAARNKTGIVGQGTAFVQPRQADASQEPATARPPWAVGGGMQLAQGSYELALWFDVPRAQVVDWTVTCPGVEVTGTAGETFAHYRARRIEELRAVSGREQVASRALAPSDAISDASSEDGIDLPAGDLGAGRLESTVRVMTGGAGVCAVTAMADDASVLGTYQVTRIRDPQLAQRAREAQHATSIEVRGRGTAAPAPQESALVEHHLAAARAQAEARVQLEAEARERAQLEYAAQIRAQQDAEVAHARVVVDPEQRRLDLATRARDDLRRRWMAWGAIPRPPMPALLAEVAGEPPYPGAVWTPGRWEWLSGRWTWRAGSWSDPDVFDGGADGGDLLVGLETGMELEIGEGGERRGRPRIVDHRNGPRIRDHRNGLDDSGPTVRDHRDRDSSSSKPEPTVRDHRNNAREEMPKSTIHDHRDSKKDDDKDDDRSGNVRDHRRR